MGYDLSLWAYGGRATRICNSFSELDYVSGKIEIGGYDQLVEQSDNKRFLVIVEARGKAGSCVGNGSSNRLPQDTNRELPPCEMPPFCLWLSLQLESPNLLFPVCF